MEKYSLSDVKLAIRRNEEERNVHGRRFFNMLATLRGGDKGYGKFEADFMKQMLCGSWTGTQHAKGNNKHIQHKIVNYVTELYYMYKDRLSFMPKKETCSTFHKEMALILGRYFIEGWNAQVYSLYPNQFVFFPQNNENPIMASDLRSTLANTRGIRGGVFEHMNNDICRQIIDLNLYVRNNADGDCVFETMLYFIAPTTQDRLVYSKNKANVLALRQRLANAYNAMFADSTQPRPCWSNMGGDYVVSIGGYFKNMFADPIIRNDLGFGELDMANIDREWENDLALLTNRLDYYRNGSFIMKYMEALRTGKTSSDLNFYGTLYDLRFMAWDNNFQMYVGDAEMSQEDVTGKWQNLSSCILYKDTKDDPRAIIRVLNHIPLHFDACDYGTIDQAYVFQQIENQDNAYVPIDAGEIVSQINHTNESTKRPATMEERTGIVDEHYTVPEKVDKRMKRLANMIKTTYDNTFLFEATQVSMSILKRSRLIETTRKTSLEWFSCTDPIQASLINIFPQNNKKICLMPKAVNKDRVYTKSSSEESNSEEEEESNSEEEEESSSEEEEKGEGVLEGGGLFDNETVSSQLVVERETYSVKTELSATKTCNLAAVRLTFVHIMYNLFQKDIGAVYVVDQDPEIKWMKMRVDQLRRRKPKNLIKTFPAFEVMRQIMADIRENKIKTINNKLLFESLGLDPNQKANDERQLREWINELAPQSLDDLGGAELALFAKEIVQPGKGYIQSKEEFDRRVHLFANANLFSSSSSSSSSSSYESISREQVEEAQECLGSYLLFPSSSSIIQHRLHKITAITKNAYPRTLYLLLSKLNVIQSITSKESLPTHILNAYATIRIHYMDKEFQKREYTHVKRFLAMVASIYCQTHKNSKFSDEYMSTLLTQEKIRSNNSSSSSSSSSFASQRLSPLMVNEWPILVMDMMGVFDQAQPSNIPLLTDLDTDVDQKMVRAHIFNYLKPNPQRPNSKNFHNILSSDGSVDVREQTMFEYRTKLTRYDVKIFQLFGFTSWFTNPNVLDKHVRAAQLPKKNMIKPGMDKRDFIKNLVVFRKVHLLGQSCKYAPQYRNFEWYPKGNIMVFNQQDKQLTKFSKKKKTQSFDIKIRTARMVKLEEMVNVELETRVLKKKRQMDAVEDALADDSSDDERPDDDRPDYPVLARHYMDPSYLNRLPDVDPNLPIHQHDLAPDKPFKEWDKSMRENLKSKLASPTQIDDIMSRATTHLIDNRKFPEFHTEQEDIKKAMQEAKSQRLNSAQIKEKGMAARKTLPKEVTKHIVDKTYDTLQGGQEEQDAQEGIDLDQMAIEFVNLGKQAQFTKDQTLAMFEEPFEGSDVNMDQVREAFEDHWVSLQGGQIPQEDVTPAPKKFNAKRTTCATHELKASRILEVLKKTILEHPDDPRIPALKAKLKRRYNAKCYNLVNDTYYRCFTNKPVTIEVGTHKIQTYPPLDRNDQCGQLDRKGRKPKKQAPPKAKRAKIVPHASHCDWDGKVNDWVRDDQGNPIIPKGKQWPEMKYNTCEVQENGQMVSRRCGKLVRTYDSEAKKDVHKLKYYPRGSGCKVLGRDEARVYDAAKTAQGPPRKPKSKDKHKRSDHVNVEGFGELGELGELDDLDKDYTKDHVPKDNVPKATPINYEGQGIRQPYRMQSDIPPRIDSGPNMDFSNMQSLHNLGPHSLDPLSSDKADKSDKAPRSSDQHASSPINMDPNDLEDLGELGSFGALGSSPIDQDALEAWENDFQ